MKRTILVFAIALSLAGCSSSKDTAEPIDDQTTSDSNPNPSPEITGSGSVTGDGSVNGDGTATGEGSVGNEAVALELVGQDLLVSLAGFQADRLSLSVRELVVEISASGEAMPLGQSTFETLDGFGPEVVTSSTQKTAYTCNAGGQMIHEAGRLRNGVGTERSLRGDYDAFTFDACRHLEAGGVFAAGDYQLDGELVMSATDYNVSSGSRSSHSNNWAGFTMSVPAGTAYELSGNVTASTFSAANFGTGDTRIVELPIYRKKAGARTIESLEDVSLSLTRTIPNGSDDRSYKLDADGITTNSTSGGTAVTIVADPPLSGRVSFNQGINEPFSGQIRMVAADGGELILSANPASQISVAPGDLLVDIVALRPDGESLATDGVPLIDIVSSRINSGCFINDSSGDECSAVELP